MPSSAPVVLPIWLRSASLPWAGALLALALLMAAAGFLHFERRVFSADALARAELYARVLEDHASRTVGGTDVALQTLAQAIETQGVAGDLTPLLGSTVQGLPFLRSVSLLDAEGQVRASSNPANLGLRVPEPVWRGGRNGLGPLQAARDLAGLARGDKVPAGVAVLPMTRTLAGEAGTLVALVNLDYFANQHQLILGDTPYDAALASYDGQLYAATERVQALPGQSLAALPVFSHELPDRESGAYAGTGLDGVESHVAWRVARRHPVVVVVQTPAATVDARVAELRGQVVLGVALALVVLGALTLLAWRSLRSHELVSRDLLAARGTLAAQDAFTDRLFEVSPVPMAVQDRAGSLLRVNRAWCDLMARDPAQMLGHTVDQALGAEVAAALGAAQPDADGQTTQHEARLPVTDGWRDVMVRRMPFADAGGAHGGTITCVVDVSEFREAERRTREAKEAAEQANHAKSEFIANISHELRTPLQSILGFSELGVDRSPAGSRQRDMFAAVQGGGRRMLTLVESLLDLSRIDATIGHTELRVVDLVPLLHAVVQELGPLATPRRVQLQMPAGNLPMLAHADAFRLQQVARNVLANALRFAPPDTVVSIDWTTELTHAQHVIRVRDHGPGIPEAELDSIFEPFVQSSRTKDGSGGTGLGLAICRKIMSAHHGSIRARNAEGGGAVFEIRLPHL